MFNVLVNSEQHSESLSSLQNFSMPNSCEDQRDHPVCRKINSDARVIQQRVSSLVYSIRAKILDSPDLNSGNHSFNSLNGGISSDFLSGLENHLFCSDYVIGEEREIQGFAAEENTIRYLVKRKSNKHYTASIAVRFTSFGFDHKTSQEPDLVYDYHLRDDTSLSGVGL